MVFKSFPYAHIFTGREVDHEGNLRQWWTNASAKSYNERALCFEEQYSRFPLPEDLEGEEKEMLKAYKINGVVTKGENIADNGGDAWLENSVLNRMDYKIMGVYSPFDWWEQNCYDTIEVPNNFQYYFTQ